MLLKSLLGLVAAVALATAGTLVVQNACCPCLDGLAAPSASETQGGATGGPCCPAAAPSEGCCSEAEECCPTAAEGAGCPVSAKGCPKPASGEAAATPAETAAAPK